MYNYCWSQISKQENGPMNQGYLLAEKLEDGSPGRPIGNEEGAVMLFDDLAVAQRIRDDMSDGELRLCVFRVNISISGEAISI